MIMHSVRQKAEPAPTGPFPAAAPVRRWRIQQCQIGRAAALQAATTPSISAQIAMPLAKIAALPPQPAARAPLTTTKSP